MNEGKILDLNFFPGQLLDFSINIDTGALAPGMLSMLFNAEKQFHTKTIQKYTKEEIVRIHELVSRHGLSVLRDKHLHVGAVRKPALKLSQLP
ncbi:MAG: hypothetical protein PF503_12385 [Desulfobacula sp.]|nr:hypothetical protein [Desulfobacula sp.]